MKLGPAGAGRMNPGAVTLDRSDRSKGSLSPPVLLRAAGLATAAARLCGPTPRAVVRTSQEFRRRRTSMAKTVGIATDSVIAACEGRGPPQPRGQPSPVRRRLHRQWRTACRPARPPAGDPQLPGDRLLRQAFHPRRFGEIPDEAKAVGLDVAPHDRGNTTARSAASYAPEKISGLDELSDRVWRTITW